MILLSPALALYDAGMCVLPAATDGSKRPAIPWQHYTHTRPTRHQIETWFNLDQSGLGVVCGAVSGNLEMLELEGRAIDAGYNDKIWERARDTGLGDLWRTVATGYRETTPGGGVHLLYRVHDDTPVGKNTKLARRPGPDGTVQVLIETRGEGGWVVTAPSNGRCHPNGGAWTLVQGGAATIPAITADERDALHDLMRTFDEMPRPEPVVTPYAGIRTGGPLSPGDDYNQRTDWADILGPHGWTAVRRQGEETFWRRPSKAEGISATTGHSDADTLYVFTTSTTFEPETSYTKFGAYAHLEHGGDYSQAARALRAAGYGAPTQPPAPGPIDAVGAADGPADGDEDDAGYVFKQFPRLNWQELWDDTSEEEWIVEPILPARRLVAIYSPAKTGKSLLMLEIAAAVAAGREVLGVIPDRPRRVLYVDFENDPKGDIRERLQAMGYAPADLDNLCYLSFPALSALDGPAGAQQLLDAVGAYACEVVVIDTISRAVAGPENDNDTWLAFYRHTGLQLKQNQIALVRLDHTGKDAEKGQRGGSAKSGDIDAVWKLTTVVPDETYQLVCEAARMPIAEKQLTLHRETLPRLRHRVDPMGRKAVWDAKDAAAVKMLDSLNIDPSLGRQKVRELLKAAGQRVGDKALNNAIQARKTCAAQVGFENDQNPVPHRWGTGDGDG